MQVATIGIDLDSKILQVHGFTKDEEVLFKGDRRAWRKQKRGVYVVSGVGRLWTDLQAT